MSGQCNKVIAVSELNITVELLDVAVIVRGGSRRHLYALQREEILQALRHA